ncbi:ribonuclease III [Candidatus Lariskella endosymbiont of Epinotia ramella]|uniref:ribonuclease III n=1 Tax=Candidatus Lariskella endosymbiont of Epinotia ramella TaxID=3066224 RepID=UPI0030CBBEDA
MTQLLINYKFNNPDILRLALTHPSLGKNKISNAPKNGYERLEFLGDSVLSMVIADIIYHEYSDLLEGPLSIIHANAVNTTSLAKVALSINLNEAIMMDHGEEIIGGRSNPRNLENAMEALIGAVFLDSDYETVKSFIKELWRDVLGNPEIENKNQKTKLQEWMQKHYKTNPIYVLENEEGDPHSPIFSISVEIHKIGKVIATGRSKKEAEQKAAGMMLEKITHVSG